MKLLESVKKIEEYCKEFNEGDLLILSDINDELSNLLEVNISDIVKERISILIEIIDHLENVDNQETFVEKILQFMVLLEEPDNIENNLDDVTFSEYIGSEEDEEEKKLYTFENLIRDIDMLEKFYDEASEHLSGAQVVLVELEYDSENSESINTIFRAFHTIKGSAAFLGIKNIEDVAHSVENMLSLVRDGKIIVNGQLIDIIFYGIKFLEDLIRVLPGCEYDLNRIINSFNVMDTRAIISLVDKIVEESSYRKLGEILEDMGKIDSSIVGEILKKQESEGKRFGDILVEEKIVSNSDVDEAIKIQKQGKIQSSYVKVHASRLNDLVDMVGELVVTQSMINQSAQDSDNSSLDKNIMQLTNISRGIKNIVLSMGMVPIGEIFNRLKVVIRNASRDLGRLINVTIVGEETELDRNLVEAIYDPLVHMVRNAVDHGIEDGEDRVSLGKSDVGNIRVAAEHKGNGIEITVEDDGRGIDREKVIKKALQKKIIKEEEVPWYKDHERESYMLMFRPGFSTKEEVSELSGRGVGLDVVKQNIESIRGKIDIQSSLGEGSKFTLRLPLTLAIIDGFVTMVDRGKFIFPFSAISEIIVPRDEQLDKLDSGEIMLNNRGQFIPVFKANEIIKQAGGDIAGDSDSLGIILIITHDNSQYGIGVDKVLGKQEIVIKSLNEVLKNMELFSGGTIFGDGSIGFVVDIDIFLEKCN